MHLEVSLSESDINSVKVGQQATVTINAASGEQVAGKVMDIGVLSSSSSSTGTSSAVSYPVTIALTQTTKGLRGRHERDRRDRHRPGLRRGRADAGAAGLDASPSSRTASARTQRVTTGVAGDSTTQVVSGLSAGQQVVVTSVQRGGRRQRRPAAARAAPAA